MLAYGAVEEEEDYINRPLIDTQGTDDEGMLLCINLCPVTDFLFIYSD